MTTLTLADGTLHYQVRGERAEFFDRHALAFIASASHGSGS